MIGTQGHNQDVSAPQIMSQMMNGYRMTQMLYVAAKLGLADRLKDGPKSSNDLARLVGADARALYRFLRTLSSMGVFAEDEQGLFGLTPLADLLRSDVPDSVVRDVLLYGEAWWWEAYGQMFYSVQTGKTSFSHVHGVSFFEYLNGNPEAAAIFNNNMTGMTTAQIKAVVDVYDFAEAKTVVDVAGGHGALLSAILTVYPHARGILFDQPGVIEGAQNKLKSAGIEDRCILVGGDFFQSVPAGGDIYTLKDIIHDWDDERSVAILQSCRRAMASDARLLLIERLLQPGNAPHIAKTVDLTMLVITGGMERTENEYRALLQRSGYRLDRVIITSGDESVLEAIPVQ